MSASPSLIADRSESCKGGPGKEVLVVDVDDQMKIDSISSRS
jgi:hypothetical protein